MYVPCELFGFFVLLCIICKHVLISIDFIASVFELFDNPSYMSPCELFVFLNDGMIVLICAHNKCPKNQLYLI